MNTNNAGESDEGRLTLTVSCKVLTISGNSVVSSTFVVVAVVVIGASPVVAMGATLRAIFLPKQKNNKNRHQQATSHFILLIQQL